MIAEGRLMGFLHLICGVLFGVVGLSPAAWAQGDENVYIAMTPETVYIFNTFMFLVMGILIMWMSAGFAMLEAGLVRSKNTVTICLKNVVIYAIAGIVFYIIGYNLMYGDGISFLKNPSDAELALTAAAADTTDLVRRTMEVTQSSAYSSMSDWFFQMVFVATAASIVSGAMAERSKLWPFFIFTAILCGIIYPIQGAWSWGGGWLSDLGFKDFAGSTIVHTVGGWAALTGVLILGARHGKYTLDGQIKPMPGANLPLATLGTFILWMGWFAFNGGSVLALGSAQAATTMSLVLVNTNLAACAGCLAAMAFATIRYKKPDLTLVLNGALAGLVSITAGPDIGNPLYAVLIGAIGGLLCSASIPLLDKLKIDDVVGAIPVHLVCGIWGTLAVGLFGNAPILAQLAGIAAVGVFVSALSALIWFVLKKTIGIRVDESTERHGLDVHDVGLEAYPDFVHRS
jgi:ammonium transporter, Amt family